MKVSPSPQSSSSISVQWTYDPGDAVPQIAVNINQYSQNGDFIATQANLPPLTGTALFTGLSANTTYLYEWCGKFISDAGGTGNPSCHEPVAGTTLASTPTPPPPGPGSTTAPTIYELTPETAKFGHPGSIVVRWRSPDQYDVWHLQWKDKAYPNRPEHWSAIELKTRLSTEFSYRATGTVAGTTYTFAVQGCKHSNLGTDRCSAYSPNTDVLMHNTHSVREWLGDAQLNPGLRSLGNKTYGQGFRAMMGI